MMKHQSTDDGIRPGVLLAAVGSIAVMVALVWALKSKPTATDATVEAATSVSPSAPARPAAAFKRVKVRRAAAPPAAVNTERPRPTAATRLSMPEMGTDTTAPSAATGLARFQGTGTFDYRTQAARVAEVVRNAIAQEASGGDAMLPGSDTDFAQSQGAGGLIYQARPGPVGRVPYGLTQPERGGAAQVAGSPGTGPYGSQAQPGPAAGGSGNASTSPLPGGDGTSPVSAGQVSQGSGPPGAQQAVYNAVEAYREGERLRRAYVEEMRVKRIAMIVEARQNEGL